MAKPSPQRFLDLLNGTGFLKEEEQALLDMFNSMSRTEVFVQRANGIIGQHVPHDPNVKSDQRRNPVISLGRKRFIDGLLKGQANEGIRNVDDVAHEDAWVLAHELGHEVDALTFGQMDSPDDADEEKGFLDKARIQEIMADQDGDQYDIRQSHKRNTPQLYADDVGRVLLKRLHEEKIQKNYLKAIDKYIDRIFQ